MYTIAHCFRGLLITLLTVNLAFAQTWIDLASIPVGPIQEHTTVLLSDSQLATVGGLVRNGSTSNILLLYDIPSNAWKQGAPTPIVLNHPNTAVVDGKIYVLGGLTGTWVWPAARTAWVYDPQNDRWSPLAAMSAADARGSAATGVYNGTIYLAGGILAGNGPTVDTVSAYHIASDTWISVPEQAAHLPAARDHMAYAQIGTKLYILGGRENGGQNVKDTVFILDLANLSAGWKTSAAKMPTARGGLTGAAVGTKLYKFGGEGNQAPNSMGIFNQTEMYDSVTDSWAKLPPMKVPRHGTSAVVRKGKVYIPGGAVVQGAGGTDVFDAFIP
ncbi:hypothetical protein MFIFM68171_00023 [Madurella fahalii]|uniref:Galactose oxidase n=1 Tax=Madurella fahalii TaxID=1157608 RepID=A0ABQ0FWC6_9PEZI